MSVGDLLHPRGATHPTTYGLIGTIYRHLAACEPFTTGATTMSEVALIVTPDTSASQTTDSGIPPS